MGNYNHNAIRITSTEIGFLWNSYMIESLVHHTFTYYTKHLEDQELERLFAVWIQETADSLNLLNTLFQQEGVTAPIGITSKDIIPNTPRLFSDKYYMLWSIHMARFALQNFSLAYAQSSRADIRQFFKHYVDRLIIVNERITDLTIAKGVYSRPPAITLPTKLDFVRDMSFFGSLFGNKRPLTVLEIMHLYYNAEANSVGKALITVFSQVTKSEKIRNYFIKGKLLAEKFIGLLNNVLLREDISITPSYDSEVIHTTTPPFSERLMLFHINLLNSNGLGSYGMAIAASHRVDLAFLWVRIMLQAGLYGKTGANLMVKNGWMEQPPSVLDRNKLGEYRGKIIPQPAMKPMKENENEKDDR